MINVYFESGIHAELVATFDSEELFIACLPTLEAEAKKQNMTLKQKLDDTVKRFDENVRYDIYI